MQWDKWQSHLQGTEKFGLLSLLFELSLIFKCLFQAFPRRGHWRICLISWSHHGAHLYCMEAMSSVPSSLFHSVLSSPLISQWQHPSPFTYPTCILTAEYSGMCKPMFLHTNMLFMVITWKPGGGISLVMNEIVKTDQHPLYSMNICQSVFSCARKMSTQFSGPCFDKPFNKLPVILPSLCYNIGGGDNSA